VQFLRQNGRILLRLELLEEQLRQARLPSLPLAPPPAPPMPSGLPLGAEAPAFDLPDLEGKRNNLAGFRGRRLLLIFFNPGCGFCTRMLPELAQLPVGGEDGRPWPLVITTGNLDENRRLFAEHKVRCRVLLQDQMVVASKYQVSGTPIGYLIDEQGKIASPMTIGKEALLALATGVPPPADAHGVNGQATHGHGGHGKENLGLENSRINRDGLKAGTPAPEFSLPRLQGGELALREVLDRRLLLVFSDPQCGPCDQLAPHLERIHRERKDVGVLVVSRREAEANQAKAAKLGLSFPIVLQKQWEISRLYGMFATPIGYLVNEQGVLLSDVAVGVDPILSLVGQSPNSGPK